MVALRAAVKIMRCLLCMGFWCALDRLARWLHPAGAEGNNSMRRYMLMGETVTAEVFDAFRRGLREVPGTWFCDEEEDGGTTGYEATGADGTHYWYQEHSSTDESIAEISTAALF